MSTPLDTVHESAGRYLDTAGLTTLFAYARGIELATSPRLAPVLEIAGLADLVPVHGLVDQPGEA